MRYSAILKHIYSCKEVDHATRFLDALLFDGSRAIYPQGSKAHWMLTGTGLTNLLKNPSCAFDSAKSPITYVLKMLNIK